MAHSRHPESTIPKDIKKRIEYLVGEINTDRNDGYVKEGLQKELNNILKTFNKRWDMPKEDHQFGQSCKNK